MSEITDETQYYYNMATTSNCSQFATVKAIFPDAAVTSCRASDCKASEENDPVNHPVHYTSHPSGVECIDIAKWYDFCIGNTIKYIWRAGLKKSAVLSNREKELEDLKKARWYLDKEISEIEKELSLKR